ncbi:MAG: Ribosome-releasing factor 2, mitochondrial [Vezdaea acicularis]|nr:MAG: Ribosome-releasing factor 2, mitochondrial [Vezdaea acicularis]
MLLARCGQVYRQKVVTLARVSPRLYATVSAVAELSRTRNIGIIAHIDAGKTTTTERMLYYSGYTRTIGDVDDGSTVTDFLPAERDRGITIQSAAITFHWPPISASVPASATESSATKSLTSHTINLIDTPGHADFTFEVLRSLRILDGAVCILDAVAGVEAQTEIVWQQANTYQIPRIIYINKLDRQGAAFGRAVKEIGSRLGGWPAVCQIPWWKRGERSECDFIGVGDAVNLRALRWSKGGDGKSVEVLSLKELEKIEPEFAAEIKKARISLVECLSERNNALIERFFELDEDHLAIRPSDITNALRECVLDGSGSLIPVYAGASFRNIGVQPLLDAVVDLLPAPNERPDPEISAGSLKGSLQSLISGKLSAEDSSVPHPGSKKGAKRQPSSNALISRSLEGCALAFKVVNDPQRGVLVYVRVYSGVLNRGATLFNANLSLVEKAPRLFKMYANKAEEVSTITTGQIGVIAGLKATRTGDTLISVPGLTSNKTPPAPLDSLQLKPIDVPPPVFFASIEPHSLAEEKNVHENLLLLLREDPSLHLTVDDESGQTLLSGMGELHLEIARDRLIKDFKTKASMGRIEISYRECILASSGPEHCTHDRDLAGRRSRAGCTATVTPLIPNSSNLPPAADQPTDTLLSEGNLVSILPLPPSSPPLPLDTSTVLLPALRAGALAALARGPLHNLPLHATNITLSFDPTTDSYGPDTTPMALSQASRLATTAALKAAAAAAGDKTALMEPVMAVRISLDERSLGAVVHDISAARGGEVLAITSPEIETESLNSSSSTSSPTRIDPEKIYTPPDPFGESTHAESAAVGAEKVVQARVPLKEMLGYWKHLRSLSLGRASFVMRLDGWERVRGARERALLAEMRGEGGR